mgnify:CR=1 FL=1
MPSDREGFCSWSNSHDIYMQYHDDEWGKPEFDGRKLFEMLTLETFQSGLSWIIILKKRDNFLISSDIANNLEFTSSFFCLSFIL